MTKPPDISLILLTYRPGGLDLLFETLSLQPSVYELIIVDDWPGRADRYKIREAAHARSIPLRWHGPSKPKAYPEILGGLANAMNTGALHAAAPLLVYIHDYAWFQDSECLGWWTYLHAKHGPKCLISGIADVYPAIKPDTDDDFYTWSSPIDPLKTGKIGAIGRIWGPVEWENFYCLVPAAFVEQVNGFDERADDHITWPYFSTVWQAKALGYKLVVNSLQRIGMADHRQWGGGLWHAEKRPCRGDNLTMPEWQARSPNPYDFKALRNSLKGTTP